MGRNNKEVIRLKRIAWIAPMDKKSAMARDSHDICNSLSRFYEIDIWTPSEENFYETNFKINKISEVENSLDIFKNYDYLVYNFGNNLMFHKKSYELFMKKPVIVILHDQTMFDFFNGYFAFNSNENNITKFLSFANKYYSEKELNKLLKVLESKQHIQYSEICIDIFNMLMPIINLSKGIYTHASFFVNKLREFYSKPIGYSYLTCERKIKKDKKEIFKLIPDDNRILIVSTGYVNLYKRIDKVIDVLMREKNIRDNVKYVVIGDTGEEYAKKLIDISNNELKGILYMLGYQSEEVMESAIYNADLCINLRYPNSEVCSLSVLEQMIYSKPVCVTNKGFFKELPDNSVIKINLENETEEIKNVLKNLISNRNFYNDIGIKAKEFVEENCKITTYAENFKKFLDECDKYDYKEDDYINTFIENVAEKYHNLEITRENGKKYIDMAVERINSIMKYD